MRIRLVGVLVLSASLRASAQAPYGFVATLGRDTVSVERVTRTTSTLVSDVVERFPRVIVRHTEITLGPGGVVSHLVMDTRLPNATTPKWQHYTYTAAHAKDSIHVTVTNGEGTQHVSFATHGDIWMPWTGQVYSLTELYLGAALSQQRDSVRLRHYYPEQQASEVPQMAKINPGGVVRRLSGNRVEIARHDALAGAGEAIVDDLHRMLSYSGDRSTFKTHVSRVRSPDVEEIARRYAAIEKHDAESGVVSPLSVRDTARGRVGAASLHVDYGRPLARGRQLVGDVLPIDSVWRTGANAATQFTTSVPLVIAGLHLDAGTYSLWTVPTRDGATLIVNNQIRQWGTQYDVTRDLGRAPLRVSVLPSPVEKFTFSFVENDATHGAMILEWGTFRWMAPIVLQ